MKTGDPYYFGDLKRDLNVENYPHLDQAFPKELMMLVDTTSRRQAVHQVLGLNGCFFLVLAES